MGSDMHITDIRLMYAYNDWANTRVLEAASRLPEALYAAKSDHSFGSIHDTLFHMLNSEVVWRTILQHGAVAWPDLNPDEAPTLEALGAVWREEARRRTAYLDQLTDADVNAVVQYNMAGEPSRARVRWHIFWHVLNHAMQHRSEVAHMLTQHGSSPGELDVMWFMPADGSDRVPGV